MNYANRKNNRTPWGAVDAKKRGGANAKFIPGAPLTPVAALKGVSIESKVTYTLPFHTKL